MKSISVASVAVTVLMACSSGDVLSPRKVIQGKPAGQPIVIDITGLDSRVGFEGELAMQIELTVTNVADYPVTVTRINILPEMSDSGDRMGQSEESFQIDPVSSGTLNRKIESGEETSVTMDLGGRFTRRMGARERRSIPIRFQVSLSNNESYLFTFQIPIRNTN